METCSCLLNRSSLRLMTDTLIFTLMHIHSSKNITRKVWSLFLPDLLAAPCICHRHRDTKVLKLVSVQATGGEARILVETIERDAEKIIYACQGAVGGCRRTRGSAGYRRS